MFWHFEILPVATHILRKNYKNCLSTHTLKSHSRSSVCLYVCVKWTTCTRGYHFHNHVWVFLLHIYFEKNVSLLKVEPVVSLFVKVTVNFIERLLHLKAIHPLWNIYCKHFTQGVLISSGIAHWLLPHEISTTSVVDLRGELHATFWAFLFCNITS